MPVENPYLYRNEQESSAGPLLTSVDRVYTPDVKDTEFLTLTTAPLALFSQPLEDGSTRYTAQIGYEFEGSSLLRYLRAIAPYPKESLRGTVADWNLLYTGDFVTKPYFDGLDTDRRSQLIKAHTKYLPPAWRNFMQFHAGPILDAAADSYTIDQDPIVGVSKIERFLYSPNDEENNRNLVASGVVKIEKHRLPKRVDINLRNRLILQYNYRYNYHREPVIPFHGRKISVLGSSLSMLPVVQWDTDQHGNRNINLSQIVGEEEIAWGLQQLHESASPLERQLDTDPSRLSSLLGATFLAYFTPDIRARQRWEPTAKLNPNKPARPVREPQVVIRVLETDFSNHPFLDAVENYVSIPQTRSERFKVLKSSSRHKLRTGLKGPFARSHPSDF